LKIIRGAIAGVPALVRSGSSPTTAAERGTVLYYHGFSGNKVPSVLDDLVARGWARPDPHHHPDRFFPVAILSQNAEHDEAAGAVRRRGRRRRDWRLPSG
jgi:hypothetical protein